jgi:hypothetical protein
MSNKCNFATTYNLSTYKKLPLPTIGAIIDVMVPTAERPVTWISVPHFMVQVRKCHKTKMDEVDPDDHDPFHDEPRETSFQCAFVPTNPYQGKVAFTVRLNIATGHLNIALMIQKRSAHIDHEDMHYCHAQRRLTKDMLIKIRQIFDKE